MPTPRQVRPGWEFPYAVEGANVQKGVACVAGSKNTTLKIASAIGHLASTTDAARARELRQGGATVRGIAEQLGLSKSQVGRLLQA